MVQLLTLAAARDRVGQSIGVSDWRLIDQALVDGFADLTGDHQFIHVDPVAAAKTPFGGTIAHGFLTLSLLASLVPADLVIIEGTKMGVNYGFDKIRFLQPVRVGRRIRARHMLAAVEQRAPGQVLVTTEVTVEIEGEDKAALAATWLGLHLSTASG